MAFSAMACVAVIVPVSACSSPEPTPPNPVTSASGISTLLMPAAPIDRLSEWSSGVPLDRNHTFIDDLGVDVTKATRPNTTLMIVDQAQVVVPYGTKCVLVFTTKGVSDESRVSGKIAFRFSGPSLKEGFGNWAKSAVPQWLEEKEAAVCR